MQIVFNAVWRQTSCFFPCLQSFCKTKLLACYLLLHFWWIPDEFAGTINDYSYKVCTNYSCIFLKKTLGWLDVWDTEMLISKTFICFHNLKKKEKTVFRLSLAPPSKFCSGSHWGDLFPWRWKFPFFCFSPHLSLSHPNSLVLKLAPYACSLSCDSLTDAFWILEL